MLFSHSGIPYDIIVQKCFSLSHFNFIGVIHLERSMNRDCCITMWTISEAELPNVFLVFPFLKIFLKKALFHCMYSSDSVLPLMRRRVWLYNSFGLSTPCKTVPVLLFDWYRFRNLPKLFSPNLVSLTIFSYKCFNLLITWLKYFNYSPSTKWLKTYLTLVAGFLILSFSPVCDRPIKLMSSSAFCFNSSLLGNTSWANILSTWLRLVDKMK